MTPHRHQDTCHDPAVGRRGAGLVDLVRALVLVLCAELSSALAGRSPRLLLAPRRPDAHERGGRTSDDLALRRPLPTGARAPAQRCDAPPPRLRARACRRDHPHVRPRTTGPTGRGGAPSGLHWEASRLTG